MYQCTSVESAKSQAPHNHFTRSATVASPEARGIPAQLVFTFLSVYQFFHQKQPRLFPCLCTYKSQRLADSLAFAPRLDFLFSAARRFPGIISTVTEFLGCPSDDFFVPSIPWTTGPCANFSASRCSIEILSQPTHHLC